MIVKLTRVNPSYSAENVTISYDVSITDASYVVSYNNIAPATIELGLFLLKHIAFDTAIFGEVVGLGIAKPFADVGQASDGVSFTIEYFREFSDASTATDVATLVTTTAQFDTASFGEVVELSVAKTLSDTPTALDSINSFDTTKALSDLVNVTDDIDGEAVIDDDQTMTFVKVTSNLGSFVDSVALQLVWQRALSDAGVVVDSPTFAVGRTLSDVGVAQDTFSRQINYSRAFQETSVFADATAFAVSNDIADNGYAAETDVKSINKLRSESATLADSGLLVSQGYVDNNDYFAETYVGVSRTF